MEDFIVIVLRAVLRVVLIAAPIAGFVIGGLNPAATEGVGGFNIFSAVIGAFILLFVAIIFFGIIGILLKIEANTRPKPKNEDAANTGT
jgi:uncharacterized membrane protein